MSSKIKNDASGVTSNMSIIKRHLEKALREQNDYPTKDELHKRIAFAVTDWDLDLALNSLVSEGKIVIDEKDQTIIWVAPEDVAKSLKNFVRLE